MAKYKIVKVFTFKRNICNENVNAIDRNAPVVSNNIRILHIIALSERNQFRFMAPSNKI